MLRALACSVTVLAQPALAEGFRPVHDVQEFLSLTQGRDLRLATFAISLQIVPDGRIEGRAMGRPVSGQWRWQDGYFCRKMVWGERPIAYNCQLVEALGQGVLRFTVNRGAGQSAQFWLD